MFGCCQLIRLHNMEAEKEALSAEKAFYMESIEL